MASPWLISRNLSQSTIPTSPQSHRKGLKHDDYASIRLLPTCSSNSGQVSVRLHLTLSVGFNAQGTGNRAASFLFVFVRTSRRNITPLPVVENAMLVVVERRPHSVVNSPRYSLIIPLPYRESIRTAPCPGIGNSKLSWALFPCIYSTHHIALVNLVITHSSAAFTYVV